jgi:choline dehydrogenase-like flavoprotein
MSNPGHSVDYIIVGGGSAGCVVASRLSEESDCSVLLLEAGCNDDHLSIRMPLAFLSVMTNPQFAWGFMSEPERALGGRSLWIPRGRILGGCSSINGMFYMRGHPGDFDEWRDLGCDGWGYADVLPYFRRSETSWRGASLYHGGEGPLYVAPIDTTRLLHEPIMESARRAGYLLSDDINGAQPEGFARGEATIDRQGRRASAARAYLSPARSRPNLRIELRALTTRVLIEHNRAVGVEYVQNGKQRVVRTEREVILCGGTYNSPQLLMLSGIGPAAELEQHGIRPVVDLAGVGRNLSEHPAVMIEFAATQTVTFLNELRMDRALVSAARWALFGSGPFASQINSANGIVRTERSLDRPDVQFMCNPIRMDARLWWPLLSGKQQHLFSVGVVGLHPRSRGTVTLRSADPTLPPRITMNVLAESADLETLRRGIREARRIYRTPPQAELTGKELTPGEDVISDADLDAFIRKSVQLTQHPVGTCSMGKGCDAVVDPQGCVRGVERLRVVDASIMPAVPGGNTNAAVIMAGERVADLIRGRQLAPAELGARRNAA